MQPLRVVVIDDEVNTCTFLRTVFEAEGHVCHTFVRAEEGEQFLSNNPSDLAMVDVYLGSLNGIDLLQRLKAQQPGMSVNRSQLIKFARSRSGLTDFADKGRKYPFRTPMTHRTRQLSDEVRKCSMCTRLSAELRPAT
jgi:CheY-like chemotaxis protein